MPSPRPRRATSRVVPRFVTGIDLPRSLRHLCASRHSRNGLYFCSRSHVVQYSGGLPNPPSASAWRPLFRAPFTSRSMLKTHSWRDYATRERSPTHLSIAPRTRSTQRQRDARECVASRFARREFASPRARVRHHLISTISNTFAFASRARAQTRRASLVRINARMAYPRVAFASSGRRSTRARS